MNMHPAFMSDAIDDTAHANAHLDDCTCSRPNIIYNNGANDCYPYCTNCLGNLPTRTMDPWAPAPCSHKFGHSFEPAERGFMCRCCRQRVHTLPSAPFVASILPGFIRVFADAAVMEVSDPEFVQAVAPAFYLRMGGRAAAFVKGTTQTRAYTHVPGARNALRRTLHETCVL